MYCVFICYDVHNLILFLKVGLYFLEYEFIHALNLWKSRVVEASKSPGENGLNIARKMELNCKLRLLRNGDGQTNK